MASASSAAQWQKGKNDDVLETVEIDPQLAASLGFPEGAIVSGCFVSMRYLKCNLGGTQS